MPLSLFDDFKATGYHSSVISTFSLDPAFYDTSLQVRLRSQGCLNNLLISDATMLDQAIEALPEAFQNAGKKYLLASVQAPGCFHPKLALRYGKAKARLIIGSANATSAGWAGNLELVSALSWSEKEQTADGEIQRGLIAQAHDWLWGQLDGVDDSNLAYKLELIRSQSPWLDRASEIGPGPFELNDGSKVDLLFSSPGQRNGLADRMLAVVDEPIERLTVISPYWDDNLAALKRIAHGINKLHVMLALNNAAAARSSTFPIAALSELKVTFHPVADDQGTENRFLHAKLFLFEGTVHDFLFLGSANCTVAALGMPGRSGINHEALLFRRLPAGSVKKMLGLSFKTKIDPASIRSPPIEPEKSAAAATFAAGVVERRNARLIWLPPAPIPEGPEAIIVGEDELQLIKQGDGQWRSDIGPENLSSNVARIRLRDGRTSRPVIVSSRDELMRFAPFPVADSIRRKLDAVISGEADLINLAKDIHLLLSDDQPSTQARERLKRVSGRTTSATIAGRDFDTPEEFRKALEMQASIKAAGIQHGDNPALQALLQIVLRGMIPFEQHDASDARDAAAAKLLDEGEDQDDEGMSDECDDDDMARPSVDLGRPQPVSRSDFERNQAALWRGIERFHDFLDAAKASDHDLDLNFVTRSLFMLYLMLHGCSKEYEIDGEKSDVLMPFGKRKDAPIQESFVYLAAQAIMKIWGPDFARSLMRRVRWSEESTVLPVQITTLTIISRWVLAAILAEVRTDKTVESLTTILEGQVPKLFAATKVFPELDAGEATATIRQMEENLGMAADVRQRIAVALREVEQQKWVSANNPIDTRIML